MMPISKEIIDRVLGTSQGETAYKVVEILMNAGFEAYWVGGTVRDLFLQQLPKDIDIATSAHPEDVQRLFPKNDASSAMLGVVVISFLGHMFEITTFREDHPFSDGRRPKSVQFASKEADAKRRDATVNAMYWNPVTYELYDPENGEKDLKEHLVRFIGDPSKRIEEDALRILRMVRLRATIDGQYEPETYAALGKGSSRTSALSGTRILEELEKILLCPKPRVALEDLWELGVLKSILPEFHVCKGIAQPKDYHQEGDVWDHLLSCVSFFTEDHDRDVRLAALFHDVGKAKTFRLAERIHFDHHAEVSAGIAEAVLKRLQMPTQRAKKISWIVAHHMMMGAFKDLNETRKAHWYFHPWFRELLQLFWLDIAGTEPKDYSLYDSIIADYDAFLNAHPRPEKPLLSGTEVMEILAMQPGESVGKVLQELHDAQVQRRVTTKKEAREFILKVKGKS